MQLATKITPDTSPRIGTDVEFFPSAKCLADPTFVEHMLTALPPKGERQALPDGAWCHRDGVAMEVGFEPLPSAHDSTPRRFLRMISYAKAYAVEHFVDTTGVWWQEANPNLYYTKLPDWLLAKRDDVRMRDLIELGCSPDFEATFEGPKERTVPGTVANQPLREAGFHIHLSLPTPVLTDPLMMCGFVLQVQDAVDPWYTPAPLPNGGVQWYRKRALFRPKPYGIEFRSLGADFLASPHAERALAGIIETQRAWWNAL